MTTGMIRRTIPFTILPLALLAVGLAGSPWLRAFPSDVITAPLFGAAGLSVLVPFVAVRLGVSRLWLTALIDVAAFVLYGLLVVLHEPAGVGHLVDGMYHGPSQLLTFALPLVSPRTLLVAPVALSWVAGAIAGECVARQWFTVLPYGACLVTFGLAYAGSVRAASGSAGDVRVSDTLLALALLVTLLLLRVAQSWVRQEASAMSTQVDGILPLRGLVIGTGTTLVVALIAAVAVQSSAFSRRSTTPERVPLVDTSQPLSPVAFISGLRPAKPSTPGLPVFQVSVDRASPAYFGIANVDYYDGDGWSFNRSFRPSGGILPADTDPALRSTQTAVTQRFRITAGPLTSAPWMPYLYRPQQVTGAAVNIDPGSGMVVPSDTLHGGQTYSVRSDASKTLFSEVAGNALPATSAPPTDTQIPGALRSALGTVVTALSDETSTPTTVPIPFLQALDKQLRSKYSLAGSPTTAAGKPSTPASKPSTGKSKRPRNPTPTLSSTTSPHTGGVSFADVLASIIGPDRSATPEQYATLFALVARQLGVPARLVTGFRLPTAPGEHSLRAGSYAVTTAEAWTWVEIPIRGSGWVVVDPAPAAVSGAQRTPSAGSSPSPTRSSTPTRNGLITQSNGGHAVAPKSDVPHRPAASHGPLIVTVLIGFGALILLALLAVPLCKRLRARRRRRPADPRRRLLGAWHESLDVLAESGLSDLTPLTSTEIVAATGERVGAQPAGQAAYLGQVANAALYNASSWIGSAEADAAWTAQRALRRLVRRRLGVRARVVAGLRYHRTKTPRTVAGPLSWAEPLPAANRRREDARWARRARHRAH
ncbi:MAG: transglutaminase domain-containing protein [Pseudonocardiales bacterium]